MCVCMSICIASFPGPTQLPITCSMENEESLVSLLRENGENFQNKQTTSCILFK